MRKTTKHLLALGFALTLVIIASIPNTAYAATETTSISDTFNHVTTLTP